MSKILLLVTSFLLLTYSIPIFAIDTLYIPKVEGTIRARYEYNTSIGKQHFQVRNARFSIAGKVSPIVFYKTEIDFSVEGVSKMLDAFIQFRPKQWLYFTFGQQKIPFSTDNMRSPHTMYFTSYSYIAGQFSTLRDVGATLQIINKKSLPFDFYLGIYNGKGIYNQKDWRYGNELSYSSRLDLKPIKNSSLSFNFISFEPTNVRMNQFDVGAFYAFKNFYFESEYLFKTYQEGNYANSESFLGFISYDFFTPKCTNLQKISPQIRYDAMNENHRYDEAGNLVVDKKQSRLAGGITFYLTKPLTTSIRLNYEQYFYADEVSNKDNKIVLECTLRF